ncbi:MAG: PHB depolymerase family esterase [Steroidobacteraceae bacterium]
MAPVSNRSLVCFITSLVVLFAGDAVYAQSTGAPILLERAPLRSATNVDTGFAKVTLTIAGHNRVFYLHRPAPLPPAPMPLVLVFHGGAGNGAQIAKMTGMDRAANLHGFAAAYPETDQHWQDGRETTGLGAADIDFVRAIIDWSIKTQGIDRSRIFATGISNGGIFTLRLACEMSREIAGFAAVAGSMGSMLAPRCRPQRAVPLMLIHGDKDEWVRWQGGAVKQLAGGGAGGDVIPVPQTLDFWRGINHCAAKAPTIEKINRDSRDGTRVEIHRYGNCEKPTELVLIKGGGHTWPGADNGNSRLLRRLVGRTSQDINATETILAFFENSGRYIR